MAPENPEQHKEFMMHLDKFFVHRNKLLAIWFTVPGYQALEKDRSGLDIDLWDKEGDKMLQRNADGQKPAANLREVFEAGDVAKPVFAGVIRAVEEAVAGAEVMPAPAPTLERARRKASEDFSGRHGVPEGWVHDIVKAIILCDTTAQVLDVVKALGDQEGVHIIRTDNYFVEPLPSGDRKLIITLRLKRQLGSIKKKTFCRSAHICTLEVHLKQIYQFHRSEITAHNEEFIRRFLTDMGPRGAANVRIRLLEQVHKKSLEDVMRDVELTESKLYLTSVDKLLEIMGELGSRKQVLKRMVEVARRKFTEEMKEKESTSKHGQYGELAARYASQLNGLANLLKNMGEVDEAKAMFEESLELDEKVYGGDDTEVATDLNNLADLLLDMGEMNEAKPLYERCIKILERKLGPDHPHLSVNLTNLARVLQDTGDLAQALPLYKRSLGIREASYGEHNPQVVRGLNNYAQCLEAIGQLEAALKLRQRVISTFETVLGENHPNVSLGLSNLAELKKCMGRPQDAVPLYERALAIRKAAVGPDHPDVGETLNNMGGAAFDMCDLKRAQDLYQQAQQIWKAKFGEDHHLVATSLNNLAHVCEIRGDLDNAQTYYEQSLAIREKCYGEEHLAVATAVFNLGNYYKRTGAPDKCLPLYERSVKIRESLLSAQEQPVLIAETLAAYAQTLRALGKGDEALKHNERAVEILRMGLGEENSVGSQGLQRLGELLQEPETPAVPVGVKGETDQSKSSNSLLSGVSDGHNSFLRRAILERNHPIVAECLHSLGHILKQMNKWYEAQLMLKSALSLMEERMSPNHPQVTLARAHLGEVLVARRQLKDALPLLQQVVQDRGNSRGPGHPDTALALTELANCFKAMGKQNEALPQLERALGIYEKAYGPEHHTVAMACNHLATLRETQGNYDTAMLLRKRVIEIGEKALGPEHPDLAGYLDAMAALTWRMGKLEDAKPLYERSLTIREKFDHESVPKSLNIMTEIDRAMKAM